MIVTETDRIEITTDIASLTLMVEERGDAIINEADDLILSFVGLFDGGFLLSADRITVTGTVSAIALNLEAGGGISAALPALLVGGVLNATAAGGMVLNTEVAEIHARVTGLGDIFISEEDGVILGRVIAADGSIEVTANGNLQAAEVRSLTDSDDNVIALTTTSGDILIDLVQAGRNSGKIDLVAPGDIREVDDFDPGVDVSGRYAHVEVGGEFGSSIDPNLELELDLGTLEFNGPDLILHHQGDLELIVAVTGMIDVGTSGTITATFLVSGRGEITLTAGEDILIDSVNAGTEAGVVNLTAVGSIYETEPGDDGADLLAQKAYLFAGAHIGGGSGEDVYLETAVGTLVAEVVGSTIYIDEVDDIELVSVIAPDGEIGIVAGGNILITGIVTTGTAAGTLFMGAVGRIYTAGDEPVTTRLLQARSNSGIFLLTQVATLEAKVGGQGNLEIREADSIVLKEVTNADGPIHVIAGGAMTAARVESLTDEKGNNVGLMTLSGDMVVDYVAVGSQNGQVSISSAGNINEAANHDKDADLKGALGILYAQGKIDKRLDRSFKPIHQCGQKQALYEFDRGEKLNLVSIRGDVELFFSLKNKVRVFATGNIHVIYLDSHGKDIYLRSKWEDIDIEYLHSGSGKGDIELNADDNVFVAGQLYNGNTGQIIVGDDLCIRAGDDIQLLGHVSAGDDINLCADRVVEMTGTIAAGDDVEVFACGGISLDGPMTAGDRIELGTCSDLTTTADAPLIAGGDIELYARKSIFLGADLVADDDARVKAECGDVAIDGSIVAADGIDIFAGRNLIIGGPLAAGGDLELYAKGALRSVSEGATLTAGMDVVLGTCRGDIELLGAVMAGVGWSPSFNHCWCWCHERPDVVINSGGAVRLFGTVTSADDVIVLAWGDIEVSGTIEAGDDIYLSTFEDLMLSPGSLLTGIEGEKARYVFLFAGDQMTLEGDINAEKVVVVPKKCWGGPCFSLMGKAGIPFFEPKKSGIGWR